MSQAPPSPLPPRFQLARMISGIWVPQAIYATAKLGLADVLAAGPLTGREVAEKAGTHVDATTRLLRALVVLDLLKQNDDGRFELTRLGSCLTSDAPDSVRSWALLWGGPMMWEPWGRLADCVRTGQMAPKLLHGVDSPFELMEQYPEDAEHFNRSMLELTRGVAAVLPAVYDFAGAKLVVDVGGGFGQVLPPLLHAKPGLRGLVYDLPGCADGARRLAAAEGLAGRCEFQGGDFFESVPKGGDVYLLKSVIHDWDDARSQAILERCRAALAPSARLLVLEWIVPERVGPGDVAIVGTDLNMLVMVGGRERTEAEYRALLASAGLRVTRVIPTPAAMSVIEAVAAA
jgi:SAM-dependent methyltransferase